MPLGTMLRSLQRSEIRDRCRIPEVWDRDSVATAGTVYAIVCFAGDQWMGTADCSVICKAGLAEPNSVQPIF